jgi:Flp pilus assembly protein TadG
MKRRRGNMILEFALWFPVLLLLVVGMIQFGKIIYTYYSLKKEMYSVARYLSVQQAVNFCDLADDPNAQNALQFALNDPNTGLPLISNLTPDMVSITTECIDPNSGAAGACSTAGCGSDVSAQSPSYIVVGIPGGYPVLPRIPYTTLQPISLTPQVTVPFGGTAQ